MKFKCGDRISFFEKKYNKIFTGRIVYIDNDQNQYIIHLDPQDRPKEYFFQYYLPFSEPSTKLHNYKIGTRVSVILLDEKGTIKELINNHKEFSYRIILDNYGPIKEVLCSENSIEPLIPWDSWTFDLPQRYKE